MPTCGIIPCQMHIPSEPQRWSRCSEVLLHSVLSEESAENISEEWMSRAEMNSETEW